MIIFIIYTKKLIDLVIIKIQIVYKEFKAFNYVL